MLPPWGSHLFGDRARAPDGFPASRSERRVRVALPAGAPDEAKPILSVFGYYYALMWVYDGRGDLQAAYPTAFTDGGTYQELIDWARAVVLGQFSDSAYGTLYPFAASYEALG